MLEGKTTLYRPASRKEIGHHCCCSIWLATNLMSAPYATMCISVSCPPGAFYAVTCLSLSRLNMSLLAKDAVIFSYPMNPCPKVGH